MMESPLPVLLFLIPFVGALLCACVGWFARPAARLIALAAAVLGAALSIHAFLNVREHGTVRMAMGGWAPPLGIEWVLDPFGAFAALLISIITVGTVLNLFSSVPRETPAQEVSFFACALLLVSGLIGMVVSGDLFNVFVHLEVASLSAYALVAAGGRGAPRAALRYLVIGSLGASLYLLGVGFIYAATGSLNMADVAARLPRVHDARLVLVGSAFIVVGLAVKMGLFPLHGWMPKAYSLSPTGAAAFMAPLVTKVSAIVLIRILFWVFGAAYLHDQAVILELLGWSGAMAIVVGGVMAYGQNDLRRILAYSSISQMGVAAVGVALANSQGMTGALLHLVNDAIMKAALFIAIGTLTLYYGVTQVSELARLRNRTPLLNAVITIAGLSLIGIPPLCGFFGKWWVLLGTFQAGRYAWAILLIVGSLTTAAYVFRIIEKLYFGNESFEPNTAVQPRLPTAAAVGMALLIIMLGLVNERFVMSAIVPALPTGL